MRSVFISLFILMSFTLSAQKLSDELTKAQIKQIERGYGLFIHFGINTFNEIEWSKGDLPVESYNPTELDCDQWVQTAKEAGFRYVILVTKHHEGFCLWDSKYTDYDVASSPVKTDVVAEVAKACKKYGLELGLYYSLWDRHEPCYADSEKYAEFMKNQLTELLTNYGEICELWFDGGWNKTEEEWYLPEVYRYTKELQPNMMMTVNHSIGKPEKINAVRLPRNYMEGDPIRYYPIDFRIKDPNLVRWDDPKHYKYNDELIYLAFEHTLCISDRWNWFQKKEMLPARPVDELEELFYWCTSNDNLLIINMSPDERGLIRTHERMRIIELADRLGIRGGSKHLPTGAVNLAFNKKISASSCAPNAVASAANDYDIESFWTAADSVASLEIDFEKEITYDRICLFEKAEMKRLPDGFSKIRTFRVEEFELQKWADGKWDTFYAGAGIGACKIINLPEELSAEKIRLKIIRANGAPSISHFSVAQNSSKSIRKTK